VDQALLQSRVESIVSLPYGCLLKKKASAHQRKSVPDEVIFVFVEVKQSLVTLVKGDNQLLIVKNSSSLCFEEMAAGSVDSCNESKQSHRLDNFGRSH